MTKITKAEFEEEVKSYTEYQNGPELLPLLKNIKTCIAFEKIRGCEFTHGQYDGKTQGELLIKYLKDHYPNCQYDYRFVSCSVVLARIKTNVRGKKVQPSERLKLRKHEG